MSTGDSIEAQRLADQRHEDLARAHDRELERAREQGRRDANDEQFKAATEQHFAVINGSIEDAAKQLATISQRLGHIETEMSTHDKVSDAIAQVAATSGSRRFSRIQAVGVLTLSSAAVGAFVLSIVTALHG